MGFKNTSKIQVPGIRWNQHRVEEIVEAFPMVQMTPQTNSKHKSYSHMKFSTNKRIWGSPYSANVNMPSWKVQSMKCGLLIPSWCQHRDMAAWEDTMHHSFSVIWCLVGPIIFGHVSCWCNNWCLRYNWWYRSLHSSDLVGRTPHGSTIEKLTRKAQLEVCKWHKPIDVVAPQLATCYAFLALSGVHVDW